MTKKHARTLKASRHNPNKQKQNIEHNIVFKEWEPIKVGVTSNVLAK